MEEPAKSGQTNENGKEEMGEKKPAKAKGGRGKDKKAKPIIDLYSPEAMENAYYICHDASEFLLNRGYKWPLATKKGK